MTSEQEKMDGWLRQSMSGGSLPALSPEFERAADEAAPPREG